jgi:predicted RND superfamily exporter protein
LAIVLAIAAGFGVARIKVDDSLSQLFRSDTPEFKLYQQESRLFPSSEFDVLVVVDGKTLLERPSIAKLRNLVIDLQLIDETRGIISLFSARQPPENGQLPAPLVPDNLPSGAAYQQLVQRISSNEIIRGKLLSTDGKLTLIVLALNPDAIQSNRLSRIVENIRQTADADLAGTGLKASLTGVPVMQLEIRNALERDRVITTRLDSRLDA